MSKELPEKPAQVAEHLETIFDFPCEFPIKAIGKDEDEFRQLVVDIVRKHAPELTEDAITTRPGSKGTYLAVTTTIEAVSRAQLDAIYHELSAHPAVIMAL
jgi:putative lipoic acid-binding regulatory protein